MKRWIFVLAAFAAGAAHAQEPTGFAWTCQGTGKNSMQCSIKNTGTEAGELCMQVAKVCKNGDHLANVCSGRMQPGEVTSKVVPSFEPKVRLLESCMGVEYRDKNVLR